MIYIRIERNKVNSLLVMNVATTASEKLYGLEGIEAGHGFLVSSTGMLIVFSALSGIAILIALLPYVMKLIAKIIPEPEPVSAKKKSPTKNNSNNDEAIAIAIAVANHTAAGK